MVVEKEHPLVKAVWQTCFINSVRHFAAEIPNVLLVLGFEVRPWHHSPIWVGRWVPIEHTEKGNW